MPGVPSYRGCDACHKQKKRCDQASPACARCTRLKIPCVGKGQLRYKFKTQTVVIQTAESFKAMTLAKSRAPKPFTVQMPLNPSNEVSQLADSFAALLQFTDPQYDLTCFGPWFLGIPKRLGASPVLDAAAAAFVSGLRRVRTSGEQDVGSLVKYGAALKSLRDTLQRPSDAKSPYTLCAIFLIMIAQAWFSKEADGQASHMEGVAHLLNASAGEEWTDEFNSTMRLNMIYPTSVEAILNPNIKVNPWYLTQWKPIYGPYMPLDEERGQPIESLDVPAVLDFPKFVREPELHLHEMRVSYTRLKAECSFSLTRVGMMEDIVAAEQPPKPDQMRALVQLETAYTLLLCYALVLNALLCAMDPLEPTLYLEALDLSQQAIDITKRSADHVPLGTGCIPVALFAAWIATDDEEIVQGIIASLKAVDVHFVDTKYVRQMRDLKRRVRKLKRDSLDRLEKEQSGSPSTIYDDLVFDNIDFNWGLGSVSPSSSI